MQSFKSFLLESIHDISNTERVQNFIEHLYNPMELPQSHGLSEAKLDIETRRSVSPSSEIDADKFPTTARYIAQTRAELPDGNHHKRVQQGIAQASRDINAASSEELKQHVLKAKVIYSKFCASRGLKGKPDLLRSNGKMEKSDGVKVDTVGFSQAPHTAHGIDDFDVCPKASSECRSGCLGTTAGGNKQYPDTSLSSKAHKSHFLLLHPHAAAILIHHEAMQHQARTAKANAADPAGPQTIAAVRPNVTSDSTSLHKLLSSSPHLQDTEVYGYSKLPAHASAFPTHVALSHTGTDHAESNDVAAAKHLASGGVVAMVAQRQKKGEAPPAYLRVDHADGSHSRHPVVNGDDDDYIPMRKGQAGLPDDHPTGVVSLLKLKGITNEAAGKFANPIHHDEDGVPHLRIKSY